MIKSIIPNFLGKARIRKINKSKKKYFYFNKRIYDDIFFKCLLNSSNLTLNYSESPFYKNLNEILELIEIPPNSNLHFSKAIYKSLNGYGDMSTLYADKLELANLKLIFLSVEYIICNNKIAKTSITRSLFYKLRNSLVVKIPSLKS